MASNNNDNQYIHFDDVRSVVSNMETSADNIEGYFKNLMQIKSRIDGSWLGDASSKYLEKIETLYKNLPTAHDELCYSIIFLASVTNDYEEITNARARELIETFGIEYKYPARTGSSSAPGGEKAETVVPRTEAVDEKIEEKEIETDEGKQKTELEMTKKEEKLEKKTEASEEKEHEVSEIMQKTETVVPQKEETDTKTEPEKEKVQGHSHAEYDPGFSESDEKIETKEKTDTYVNEAGNTISKPGSLNPGYAGNEGKTNVNPPQDTVVKNKETTDQVVQDVLAGKYGNGEDRRIALEKAGYSYEDVQGKVNEHYRQQGNNQTSQPTYKPTNTVPDSTSTEFEDNIGYDIDKIAKDVIYGRYGNGAERKAALKKAGYDPDIIQKRVNDILRRL